MFKISKIFKLSGVLLLLLLSFLITDSKANAQSCDDSWTISTRGCKTDCMKDGLFCFWDEGKSWADSSTNSCVVESTTPCPSDPSNGSYAFSCNTNDCVLTCSTGYTKCGTSCVANDPLPANCTSYDQCTDTCTSCVAGYTIVSGVCEGVSLKLANDSVGSGGNIIQSTNPIFYINPIGNVGISTSTPQSKLHVIGGVKMSNLDGSYRVPVADTELVPRKYVDDNFAPITGGSGSAFLQGGNFFGTTATLGTNDAYNLDFITSSTTRMTIDASGKVGIGTASPGAKLDIITSSTDTTGLHLKMANISNGAYSINFDRTGTNVQSSFNWQTNGVNKWNMGQDNDGTEDLKFYDWVGSNWFMKWYSGSGDIGIGNNFSSLYVQHAGKVGIGTTSPSEKLEVEGGNILIDQTGATLYLNNTNEGLARAASDGRVSILENGAEALTIHNNNVGIATTTPQSKLHVIGAAKMSNLDGSYRVPVGDTELVPRKYVDDNFASIIGGASATFVGLTPNSYNGNQGGYTTANTICSNEYADSHICTTQEVLYTVNSGSSPSIPVTTAWMSGGAPGYTANANDCQGWESLSHGDYGKVWIKLAAGDDGFGALSWCDVAAPFMCCK
ncbi:MAG TPA: hypothetical protein VJ926_02435 [Patescibacteria group bacterium]|nr:hypothetical protein [Patescibacteria group bacterium]